uniref:Uncharacterized protein n=1 Tax=Caenorhabditis japonica TaxID=281687 RepID=A0A8R1I682_CAEJA
MSISPPVCQDLLFIGPRPAYAIQRFNKHHGPSSNAEAAVSLRKTTILANFDEFQIPMVTPLICFDPDTQFCGWKYTSPWFTLEKPSHQIATTTSVLTPISSSLRRRKSTTARTSMTSRIPPQSTFPSAAVLQRGIFVTARNMFPEQAARQHLPLLRRRKE